MSRTLFEHLDLSRGVLMSRIMTLVVASACVLAAFASLGHTQAVSPLPSPGASVAPTPPKTVAAPARIDLAHYTISNPVVSFDHAKHGAANVACATCHHKRKDGKVFVQCSNCHQNEAVNNVRSSKDAFHKRCKGCHDKKKSLEPPTKCSECHAVVRERR